MTWRLRAKVRTSHFERLVNSSKSQRGGQLSAPLAFGATDQIRTGDLLITNQLLYRLSHSSIYYSLYRLEAYGLLTFR